VPVSLYVAAMCLITVIALLAARETRGQSLHDDSVEAETAAVSP
jgi:hypothetical protein